MTSLSVNINGIEYTNHYGGIDVGYEQTKLNATVFVDGSDIINHFNVTTDDKWVGIQRMRNEITIVINKNTTLYTRNCTITFTHNMNSDVYVNLIITQQPCNYNISVDRDYILFDTLLDSDDQNKTDVVVHVTTSNGMCDFRVGYISEYVRDYEYTQYKTNEIIFEDDTYYIKNENDYIKGTSITSFPYTVQDGDKYYYYEVKDTYRVGETIFEGQKYWYKDKNIYNLLVATEDILIEENDGVYYRFNKDYSVPYDNGLKLSKINKQTLLITNYGKVCLHDDFYYILTLQHINNPESIAQIRVDYVDSFVNNESGFGFDDGQ